MRGFWHGIFVDWKMIEIDLNVILNADFAAAVVLITYGALLGKVNFNQILTLAIFETFIWSFNETLLVEKI